MLLALGMESAPNILDLALMALLCFFLVRGVVRGFVRETMGLVGVVAAIVISALFYQELAALLERLTKVQGQWWPAVAFGLILVLVLGLSSYLGAALSRLILSGPLSLFDRTLGAGLGLAKGVLVTYLLLNLMLLALPFQAPDSVRRSIVAPYVVQAGRAIVDLLPDDLTTRLQERAGLLRGSPANDKEKK